MSKLARQRKGEQGSVLVIALIMVVLLTVIGISASRNTEIEIMIAGNERVAKENFYIAEAAASDAISDLEAANLKTNPPGWLIKKDTYLPADGRTAVALPASSGSGDLDEKIHEDANWDDALYSAQIPTLAGGNARCLAIELGQTKTGSLVMTSSKTYDFDVYGRSSLKNGQGLVKMGYRKAY